MGLFTSSAPVQLQPVNPPLGVLLNYAVHHPTTLVLKEHAFAFSGDDFSIKDTNGVGVVKCAGQAFSFRDRKVITDMNGQVLFCLRTKMFSLRKTYIAEDANEREIFRVTKKMGLGTKMLAEFTNASSGHPVVLELRGDFWGGSGDIAWDGRPVAQITRDLMNAREIFTNNQTYFMTVAPGVDLALMSAICICFDEAKNEQN